MDGGGETVGTGSTAVKTGGLISARGCITGPADGSNGIYNVVVVWRGSTPLPDNTAVTCGLNNAAYGTNGIYRRTLTVTAYITGSGS